MNILPFLILLFALLKNKGNFELLDYLKNVDYESITPFLQLFNINPSIIEKLNSDEFKNLLNGKVDLKTLLPLAMPIITEILKNKGQTNFQKNEQYVNEYLSPIKDFAGDYITSTFKDYFEN